MPRWLAIVLCLALLALIMLAVRAALIAAIPEVMDWTRERIGHAGIWLAFALLFAVCAMVGYGPRDSLGRLRLPRWR